MFIYLVAKGATLLCKVQVPALGREAFIINETRVSAQNSQKLEVNYKQ